MCVKYTCDGHFELLFKFVCKNDVNDYNEAIESK